MCVGEDNGVDEWSGPPSGTLVPLSCGLGEVTIDGQCTLYEWDLGPDRGYDKLPEPIAEVSGAVVGNLFIAFGDGPYLGKVGNPTSDSTKKTFAYDFITKKWDSTLSRRPHWGDHQSVEVGGTVVEVIYISIYISAWLTTFLPLALRSMAASCMCLPAHAVRSIAADSARRSQKSKFMMSLRTNGPWVR